MHEITQQQQRGGFLKSVKRLFSAKRPPTLKSLTSLDQPPTELPRFAAPPRRQSDVGFSQGTDRRAAPPPRDRLRRFSIDAADVARGRRVGQETTDSFEDVAVNCSKKIDLEERVSSLPDTLRVESRQESANSDVDNSAATFDGSKTGSGTLISTGRRGSGPGWHGRSGTGTATDQSVAPAKEECIMTPGGQMTVAEAREALGAPPQPPSPCALPMSESSSSEAADPSSQQTHEIMVGGELRTATIHELTTLVAFGVVLPTMMDFRKIGLSESKSGMRNDTDRTPTAEEGKQRTTAPKDSQSLPRHNRTRRNSMPSSTAQSLGAAVSLPRTPPPAAPQPLFQNDPAPPPSLPKVPRARRYSLPDTSSSWTPPDHTPISQPGSQPSSIPSSRRNSTVTASTSAIARELPDFERELNSRMTPAIFLAGEYVIRKREVGREMYFLSKGKVEVVSSDGKTVYSTIGPGSFFGMEISCIL
ncbi:Cyclic nucleotide-gated olfactory channel [Geranomyces michiganensis]|nr:Cyclic nucleotide-gated olfactory channel [Geranomyces michiganensis]